MRKSATVIALCAMLQATATAEVTLDYCLAKAEENYPLIDRYRLVEMTTELSLSDINRSWLPKIEVYAQASAQNVVPEFPEMLDEVLTKLGQDVKGLGHFQYKTGVDISQPVWDGGMSKARRNIERLSSAERQASIAVRMYAVREKVIDLYFGILLLEEQMAQTENTISLLKANHSLMMSMKAGGVAMQCDVDMVEAQCLSMAQQLAAARSTGNAYRDILSIYIGESLDAETLSRPMAEIPLDIDPARPELEWYESMTARNNASNAAIESSLMPRIGFFAQAWYGYPGINYFESMTNRDLSLNALAGVKISWNIDSFYTRKNSLKKLALGNEEIENDRDIFLYNTRIQTSSQTEAIEGMRAVMADDSRIVALRSSVRQAAESQLRNGVIDATALLSKITDENQARLNARYHEIQLLYDIYKLKFTLNR